MSRSPIQIYALCVCFSALLCFVIALGVGLYDVVQITVPAFTLQELPYYHSNEQFLQYFPDKKGLPSDEVTRLCRETYREGLAFERRGAQQSAVFVLIILAIDVVVYFVHWRIARRAEHRSEVHQGDKEPT
ncbi:MAG: hypothetical protein ACHRXM_03975 [Isosphaerales bacterium]